MFYKLGWSGKITNAKHVATKSFTNTSHSLHIRNKWWLIRATSHQAKVFHSNTQKEFFEYK